MGALTPVCSGSSGQPSSMNSGSFSKQVSLIHASRLPDHSVSNHLMDPCCRFITLPLSATVSRFRSRLRHRFAGSPITPGRIEFVILRTGRSPPAAPHNTSLCRSCFRLQAGERLPEEDFHLSDYSRFQAHGARASRPLGAQNARLSYTRAFLVRPSGQDARDPRVRLQGFVHKTLPNGRGSAVALAVDVAARLQSLVLCTTIFISLIAQSSFQVNGY
jgi:hypothetical protein